MPIYEYACEKCGKQTDVLQKVNDPAPETCEACGAKGSLSRQVSRTSFVLKGGGWYSDLYGSTKKDSGAPPSTAGTSGTTGSTAAAAPAPSGTTGGAGTGGTGTGGSGSSSGSAPASGSGNSGGSPPPSSSSARPASQGSAA